MVLNTRKSHEDVRTETESVGVTVALVIEHLRGSSGQQAAAATPSELRLTERPHPYLMRSRKSPHKRSGAVASSGRGRLRGGRAGPGRGGFPRPAGPATFSGQHFHHGPQPGVIDAQGQDKCKPRFSSLPREQTQCPGVPAGRSHISPSEEGSPRPPYAERSLWGVSLSL